MHGKHILRNIGYLSHTESNFIKHGCFINIYEPIIIIESILLKLLHKRYISTLRSVILLMIQVIRKIQQ